MIPTNQLAMYLPYNLQFYGACEIWKFIGMTDDGDVVLTNGIHAMTIEADNVGVEFAPMLKPMQKVSLKETDSYFNDTLNSYSTFQGEARYHHSKLEWMLKRGYDVFGLIEQGLAVDISTFQTSKNAEDDNS